MREHVRFCGIPVIGLQPGLLRYRHVGRFGLAPWPSTVPPAQWALFTSHGIGFSPTVDRVSRSSARRPVGDGATFTGNKGLRWSAARTNETAIRILVMIDGQSRGSRNRCLPFSVRRCLPHASFPYEPEPEPIQARNGRSCLGGGHVPALRARFLNVLSRRVHPELEATE